MTRKEKLRKEALEACNSRGHSMNKFEHDKSKHKRSRASSTCKKCGMQVSITPLFSYEIIGEAVALDCNPL